MAKQRDYYEILGVGRNATTDEIKKAYKQLAKKYHPDKNQGNKDAEARFKEISEAYVVLSNPEARRKYDTFGAQGPGAGGFDFSGFDFNNMSGGFSAGGQTFSGSFGDILSEIFGGGRRRSRGWSGMDAFGFGGEPPGGRDLEYRMEVDFDTAAQGGVMQIQLAPGNRVSVRIPAGVENGQRIRVRGKGVAGPMGGAPGDLVIEVQVGAHPFFTRVGLDLRCTVPITIGEAVLGGQIDVPTLDGSSTITLPPGTQSGQTFRLRGRGIHAKNGRKGDLYATVKIVVPKDISDKSRTLIETFERENKLYPRQNLKQGWGK